MKDTLGRIICTGDVIMHASASRYSELDTYYVIGGYNDYAQEVKRFINAYR